MCRLFSGQNNPAKPTRPSRLRSNGGCLCSANPGFGLAIESAKAADQRLSFNGSQRDRRDRRFDARGRARRPFTAADAFRPRTLRRDDPPRERAAPLSRMRMRHVEKRDRRERHQELLLPTSNFLQICPFHIPNFLQI